MKKQLPGWAVLLIITLAAGLALGGTYALTKDPIEQQAVMTADKARKAALPDAETFEELTLADGASVDWAYAGLKDGNTVGYVAQKTVNGFGGKVEVIAGVNTQNAPDAFTIGGISVGGSGFSETAGLGARSKEPAFTDQFIGKNYQLKLIKAGDEAGDNTIDALTSATITSTAVVNGVNDIVKYIKADVMGIAGVEMPAKPAAGVYSASAKGFRGPVYVEAAFDAANTVTYISVGDDSFAEDIGAGATDPEFMIQFIGKTAPVELADVDVLAGATITTKAVLSALNDAATLAGGGELPTAEEIVMPEKPADGVFSASDQGFAGPVYVEAAFDEAGKITYIGIGDGSFAETEGFGARALTPEEQYPFIGAQMPLEIGGVDVLSGATYTKTAIVNALNKAYAASKGEMTEEPVKEEIILPEKPADGVFSAAEKGFAGPVYVEAAFDGDGKVSYISVGDGSFAETDGFGSKALLPENQAAFIGKQMPMEISDVDVLSGATYTKTAIVNGLNKAYAASKGEMTEEPAAEEPAAEKPAVTYRSEAFGFESDVAVEAAFEDGKITWISIGDDRFAETPGLGAKALEEAFQSQFIGKQMPLALTDIDAIANATFTSKAVVEALNRAYEKSQAAAEAPAEPEAAESQNTVSASAQGFAGPVAVEAAFEDGKITYISIGDDQFAETPGLGAKALEEDFQAQFIGKQMPLALTDIDAIANATITSTAVVNALNQAYEAAEQTKAGETEEPAAEEPAAEKPAVTYRSEAFGFESDVAVEAAFEDGKITWISIGDDRFAETPGLGAKALEEAFQSQFIGKQMPLALTDIDAIANATFTSKAVVEALNKAYEKSQAAAEAPAEPEAEKPEDASGIIGGADEPTEILPGSSEGSPSIGEAISFFTAIQVEAEFENNVLTALKVSEKPLGTEAYASSPREEAMKEKFIGSSLPLDTNQDTAYASAVAVAVNQAFAKTSDSADGSEAPWYTGECFIFFDRIEASAIFEGNTLSDAVITKTAVGGDATAALDGAWDILLGSAMPLNAEEVSVGGAQPYTVQAVVIALNQAYENSLAGQQ